MGTMELNPRGEFHVKLSLCKIIIFDCRNNARASDSGLDQSDTLTVMRQDTRHSTRNVARTLV